ncbi:MAG: hypothetical protein AAF497_18605 [Planctomycetota bacterium]
MSRSILCRIAALCLFCSASAFSQDTSTTTSDTTVDSQSSDVVLEEGDAEKLRMSLDKVTEKLTNQRYLLQYDFHQGESVYYEVVHQSSVGTRVQGISEEVKSRSKSLKRWDFLNIQADSVAKFMHTIEQVDMWSETTGRDPIHYDSLSDAEVPAEYRAIAESIGKPISVVTANRFGKIIKREDKVRQIDRGTGGLLIPLPPKPILVKTEWAVPASVVVALSDGRHKDIKTRQRYRLEKVETGIATISLETQVLTPIADARVKSQLVQKLSKGTIKFDIDAGRMISKELNWDETVIGFNGPESNMSFLARMTERIVSQKEVTASRNPLRNTK